MDVIKTVGWTWIKLSRSSEDGPTVNASKIAKSQLWIKSFAWAVVDRIWIFWEFQNEDQDQHGAPKSVLNPADPWHVQFVRSSAEGAHQKRFSTRRPNHNYREHLLSCRICYTYPVSLTDRITCPGRQPTPFPARSGYQRLGDSDHSWLAEKQDTYDRSRHSADKASP